MTLPSSTAPAEAGFDLAGFLAAPTLAGRLAALNVAAGRRLSSGEAAELWLHLLEALAAAGEAEALPRLMAEFLRIAPQHAKAPGLYRAWRGARWQPLDGEACLVCLVVSTRDDIGRALRLQSALLARAALAYVAHGEPGIGEATWTEDGRLAVEAPDGPEGAPQALLAAVDAVLRRHGRVAILKLDAACTVGAAFDPAQWARLATQYDYAGLPVGTPEHDRLRHVGETLDPATVPYGRRFHGPWAHGAAVLLGPRALDLLHHEWAHHPGEFDAAVYEDKMVGDFLRRSGVALTALDVSALGLRLPSAAGPVRAASVPPVGEPPAALAPAIPTPACSEELLLALPRPIAVVGNGRAARDFGEVIDRYASVIRLNNYRLDGFAAQVGTRTTARCTSGWSDIEPRGEVPEFSPFTEDAAESAQVRAYRRTSGSALPTARTDVHPLLHALPRPSTGLALLGLLSSLGIEADAFGFDGFATGHYWSPEQRHATTHSPREREALLGLPGITLYGESYPYAALYDFCHAEHVDYNHNEGLAIYRRMGGRLQGESILEFGAGNGQLSAHLERQGNRVTAVEVSTVAFSRIPVARKIQGDCLTLTKVRERFDRFVSMDVLEHLTENDIRIVIREAARLARSLLVTVSTRPSGLLGPRGENLHLTVRPVHWWLEQFAPWFDVEAAAGDDVGQLVLEGPRRSEPASAQAMAQPPRAADDAFELPKGYRSRERAEYYVDSAEGDHGITWQPDIYPLAADLARSLDCTTVVDLGCGHARKLAGLNPEFDVIGIDHGPNIDHCRSTHRFGHWLESDLERHSLLPLPPRLLARSLLVCSDVIEHLSDPRPLLATLRSLLAHAPAAVISTPDRERTHGRSHAGPPPNPAHTREWSLSEFRRLLEREGLDLAAATHTRSNDRDNRPATIVVVVVNRRHPALAGSAAGLGQVPARAPELALAG